MTSEHISRAVVASLLMCAIALPAGAQVPRQTLQPAPTHWLQFGYAIDASADTRHRRCAPDSIRNNDASVCSLASPHRLRCRSPSTPSPASRLGVEPAAVARLRSPPPIPTGWEPRFGNSVSLRGNTLAVSAPRLPVNGVFGVGGFYIFQRPSPSAAFSRVGPIRAPTPAGHARLGRHIQESPPTEPTWRSATTPA